MLRKLSSSLLLSIPLLIGLSLKGSASIVNADAIYLSTFTGGSLSGSITISSSVFLISQSSITLQGAGGYIQTQSSITASAFFGDVSPFVNTVYAGGNTFVSSFTIQSGGRPISFSTGPTGYNLQISSAGAVSFSPSLHNSSSVVITGNLTTTTTFFANCLPGTSLTITTSGGKVKLVYSGRISNTGTSQFEVGLAFLQDGAIVPPFSTTSGIVGTDDNGEGKSIGSFSYLLDAPTPGAHTYCLSLCAPANAQATLWGSGDASHPVKGLFYVEEIK